MTADGAPTLSICTPTYNRAPFLDSLLRFLAEDRPLSADFELVICDNGSTDETPAVVRRWAPRFERLVYRRQRENLGAVANLQSAYRLASGRYALYLADDDRLTPGAVDGVLAFMGERPSLVAAHAPWEVWWVLDKGPVSTFYRVDADTVFTQATAPSLFNFIINNHVFPEICVYRTDAMQRMMSWPRRRYWPFVHLADILDYGDVAFLRQPYYRHTVEHPGFPPRQLEGAAGVFNERDAYEAGLEYLAHRCLEYGHQAVGPVPQSQHAVVAEMIRAFMDRCLEDAIAQLDPHQRDFEGAIEYLTRLASRGKLAQERRAQLNDELVPKACVHAFLRLFDSLSIVDRVVVTGFSDPEASIGRLREQRPELTIEIFDPAAFINHDEAGRTLVFAGPDGDAAALRQAGYPPGMIVSEADLTRRLHL